MIDWFNKKLDGQSLSRRYRGDFWTEREFWEEERLSHRPDVEEAGWGAWSKGN